MKTIVEPIKHSEKSYVIPCVNQHCKAVLEVEHRELRYVMDQRDGDFYQFDCPHCKKYVTIYSGDLEEFIKR